jgi:hypothetical protein
MATVADQMFETVPAGGAGNLHRVTEPTDLVARVWVIDLRRRSFSEIGGTSRPTDIWQCVHRRIETEEITDRGAPVTLSPAQVKEVKRRARDLVTNCAAAASHAVI